MSLHDPFAFKIEVGLQGFLCALLSQKTGIRVIIPLEHPLNRLLNRFLLVRAIYRLLSLALS
jgi:hypothetical protein